MEAVGAANLSDSWMAPVRTMRTKTTTTRWKAENCAVSGGSSLHNLGGGVIRRSLILLFCVPQRTLGQCKLCLMDELNLRLWNLRVSEVSRMGCRCPFNVCGTMQHCGWQRISALRWRWSDATANDGTSVGRSNDGLTASLAGRLDDDATELTVGLLCFAVTGCFTDGGVGRRMMQRTTWKWWQNARRGCWCAFLAEGGKGHPWNDGSSLGTNCANNNGSGGGAASAKAAALLLLLHFFLSLGGVQPLSVAQEI